MLPLFSLCRSHISSDIPGEQLGAQHAGRYVSGHFPVYPSPVLALLVSWHQTGNTTVHTQPLPCRVVG